MRAGSAVLLVLAAMARIRTTFAVAGETTLLPSYSTKAVTDLELDLADGDDGSDDDSLGYDTEEDSIDDVGMEMSPTSGQARPTDNLWVEWEYDGHLTGVATIEVLYSWPDEDEEDYGTSTTSVDWSESSISLPPRFLPHVHPGSTSSIWLWAYTLTGSDTNYWSEYFTLHHDIALYASETSTPPLTVTHTLTPTQTDLPAPTSPTPDPESDSERDSESRGLSTGGKAGIGIGVSAGAILIAAGAFLLVRRRKRQEPKTIREIPATSATNLPGPAP
ncbi:hypothetical protein ASPVEDRAFT_71036 [Aspergillus versicolor CBS 583.65]|uniref:Gram-positive cocci surface proteins LPxTG domain-containing protein n=1 Tax=Aspergillus versicolor CBS 583.65 TaxID=1036611 RepID=A0A1L9PH94_ASPVE|nr:uncharacterized protein ASPVEDRAFT_71036 [Aspergillus versicolor CBS 583.65]OJJ00871.1 hypothetical protein ASPVEDRAFT_71036 [Aspergillus versicolor CBS 583.65]